MCKQVTFDLTPIVYSPPTQVQVKALCGDELRRFTLETATCAALVCKLRNIFGIHPSILKYRDHDGDYITFSSDTELNDAIDNAPGALRLLVIPAVSRNTSPQPALASTPTPTHVQYQMPIYVAYSQGSTQSTPSALPPVERPFKPVHTSTRSATRRSSTVRRQTRIASKSSSDPGRILDAIGRALGWMVLGAVLNQGIPIWILFFASIALHRRFSFRPVLEREFASIMKKRPYSKTVTYHNAD